MAIKGQKFHSYSQETKIEVVKKFLKGSSSKELLEEYGIRSRTQLKVWTRIYREHGPEGLKTNKRGRPKKDHQQNEIEQLRMENEILKKIQDLLEQEKP